MTTNTETQAPLLLIHCADRCGLAIAVALPLSSDELERVCAAQRWYIIGAPPGTYSQPVASIICTKCARRNYAKDVLAEMDRRRAERVS